MALRGVEYVLRKLDWMQEEAIWPNGLRYLWTDAFGLVLYVSLYREQQDETWLDRAEWLVGEVDRVLGRARGYRIGQAPDRDGQYFHYLAMWLFALACLAEHRPRWRERAIEIVRAIHPAFFVPGIGVVWKMREDLSGPYPGFGLGAIDAYNGYVAYRALDPVALAPEISDMASLIEHSWQQLEITQDLGLGMMLWLSAWSPDQRWAPAQTARALATLDRMWVDPPGYFCRDPGARLLRFAFTNYGVSLGLQAHGVWSERVAKLNSYFEGYRSGDEYDREPITHVMACTSHLPGAFLPKLLP